MKVVEYGGIRRMSYKFYQVVINLPDVNYPTGGCGGPGGGVGGGGDKEVK